MALLHYKKAASKILISPLVYTIHRIVE